MSSDEKPIYEHSRSYFKIEVYSNRVVIFKPGTFNLNEQIIPIKSITDIKISGVSRVIEITTMDGKTHKIDFVTGEHSTKLRDVLLKLI
ncbi:MAG: hypothetical protein WA821_09380 [Anaerolineales bacterium]